MPSGTAKKSSRCILSILRPAHFWQGPGGSIALGVSLVKKLRRSPHPIQHGRTHLLHLLSYSLWCIPLRKLGRGVSWVGSIYATSLSSNSKRGKLLLALDFYLSSSYVKEFHYSHILDMNYLQDIFLANIWPLLY